MRNIHNIIDEQKETELDSVLDQLYETLIYYDNINNNIDFIMEAVDESSNNKLNELKNKIKNIKPGDVGRMINKAKLWFEDMIQRVIDHFMNGKAMIIKCGGKKKVEQYLRSCNVGVKLVLFKNINESVNELNNLLNKIENKFDVVYGTEEDLKKIIGINDKSELPELVSKLFFRTTKNAEVIRINQLDVNTIITNTWDGMRLKRCIEKSKNNILQDIKNDTSSLHNNIQRTTPEEHKGTDLDASRDVLKNGRIKVKYVSKIISLAIKYATQASLNCKAIITKAYSKYHNKYNRLND